MEGELRHCVYCRRAKREHALAMVRVSDDDAAPRWQIQCLQCAASSPASDSQLEVTLAWNYNTEVVADSELSAMNLRSLADMHEQWKQRALASAEFADDLATLMAKVVDLVQEEAPAIAAKHEEALQQARAGAVERAFETASDEAPV